MDKLWAVGAILAGGLLIYGGWTGSYTNVWTALKNQVGAASSVSQPETVTPEKPAPGVKQ